MTLEGTTPRSPPQERDLQVASMLILEVLGKFASLVSAEVEAV